MAFDQKAFEQFVDTLQTEFLLSRDPHSIVRFKELLLIYAHDMDADSAAILAKPVAELPRQPVTNYVGKLPDQISPAAQALEATKAELIAAQPSAEDLDAVVVDPSIGASAPIQEPVPESTGTESEENNDTGL